MLLMEGQVHDMILPNAHTSPYGQRFMLPPTASRQQAVIELATHSSEQICDPKDSATCHTIGIVPLAKTANQISILISILFSSIAELTLRSYMTLALQK